MKKIVIIVLVFLVSSCLINSTKSGDVGIDRKQFFLVSNTEMVKGAKVAYQEVLKKASKAKTLNTNKKLLNRIRVIAKNLIKYVGVFRADAIQWKWESNLITSKQINAWCMPGGKIIFYTGIIEKLKLTDGQIAAIMGHEISHALREHGRERASQALISKIGLDLLGSLVGIKDKKKDLANLVLKTTFLLPNSRKQEREADRIGVELIARAGYNPNAAVEVWQKMAKLSNSTVSILSTHPSNQSRIADLKVYAKKVYAIYQRNPNKL